MVKTTRSVSFDKLFSFLISSSFCTGVELQGGSCCGNAMLLKSLTGRGRKFAPKFGLCSLPGFSVRGAFIGMSYLVGNWAGFHDSNVYGSKLLG
jgi:hypothetical protein